MTSVRQTSGSVPRPVPVPQLVLTHHQPAELAMTRMTLDQLPIRVVAALGCTLALLVGSTCIADEDTAAVQPFVRESTFLVVKVDPAKIALPDVADVLKVLPAQLQDGYQRWATQAQTALETLRAASGGQTVYASIGIPISRSQWPLFVFFKATPGLTVESVCRSLNLTGPAQACLRDDFVVLSPVDKADVAQLLDSSSVSSRAELAAAFEAAGSYPIQILLLPPAYVRRTVQETMTELPKQLGGGPSDLLADGLGWAALGVDTAALRAELTVLSTSEDAARKLAEHLPHMLQSLYEALPQSQARIAPDVAKTVVGLIRPEVAGSRITVRMDGRAAFENVHLLATVAAMLQGTLDRRRDSNHMKQMLLAMHNYHDAHNSFPPGNGVRDAEGRSKLSWRVYLLPFLGQETLYKEFHLDEPWDSPHNKALIEKMPDVYKSQPVGPSAGNDVKPGYTTFLAPVGEDTVFGGTKAVGFRDIRDGTSNTVVLVQVRPEFTVPWTAADGLRSRPRLHRPKVSTSGWTIGSWSDSPTGACASCREIWRPRSSWPYSRRPKVRSSALTERGTGKCGTRWDSWDARRRIQWYRGGDCDGPHWGQRRQVWFRAGQYGRLGSCWWWEWVSRNA